MQNTSPQNVAQAKQLAKQSPASGKKSGPLDHMFKPADSRTKGLTPAKTGDPANNRVAEQAVGPAPVSIVQDVRPSAGWHDRQNSFADAADDPCSDLICGFHCGVFGQRKVLNAHELPLHAWLNGKQIAATSAWVWTGPAGVGKTTLMRFIVGDMFGIDVKRACFYGMRYLNDTVGANLMQDIESEIQRQMRDPARPARPTGPRWAIVIDEFDSLPAGARDRFMEVLENPVINTSTDPRAPNIITADNGLFIVIGTNDSHESVEDTLKKWGTRRSTVQRFRLQCKFTALNRQVAEKVMHHHLAKNNIADQVSEATKNRLLAPYIDSKTCEERGGRGLALRVSNIALWYGMGGQGQPTDAVIDGTVAQNDNAASGNLDAKYPLPTDSKSWHNPTPQNASTPLRSLPVSSLIRHQNRTSTATATAAPNPSAAKRRRSESGSDSDSDSDSDSSKERPTKRRRKSVDSGDSSSDGESAKAPTGKRDQPRVTRPEPSADGKPIPWNDLWSYWTQSNRYRKTPKTEAAVAEVSRVLERIKNTLPPPKKGRKRESNADFAKNIVQTHKDMLAPIVMRHRRKLLKTVLMDLFWHHFAEYYHGSSGRPQNIIPASALKLLGLRTGNHYRSHLFAAGELSENESSDPWD